MVNIHSILDGFFMLLKTTGYVNNEDLMKVMLLSLIDDYGSEMIECNLSYREVLQRIVGNIEGSSCLFRIGVCSNELFDIENNQQVIPIPIEYILNIDNNNMSSITRADIDNLVR